MYKPKPSLAWVERFFLLLRNFFMKKVETGNDGMGTVSSLGSGLVAKSQNSQQLDLSQLRSSSVGF